ncbi:MAG: VWA domain-containing protein, partial [Phycisphaerales bacterium]
PTPEPGSRPTKPREIVLVLDRSGSMRNEKIKQAKEAALQVVAGLKPADRFNIIDYSDSISSLAPGPIAADEAAVKRATAYITAIEANGGTNIHDALLEALRPPASDGHFPVVLFLTDGLPTVGERNEVKIRRDAAAANTGARRIFTFGVGLDVNAPLLSTLASETRGANTFVLPGEDVEVKVGQVYRRLAGPVLAGPSLKVASSVDGPQPITDQMPKLLSDVFEGDQVLLFGRYRGDSKVILSLSGEYFGKATSFQVSFDPKEASVRNSFVPRLWAERKVTSMVDEIRQAGAEGIQMTDPRIKELVDEIVRLSTRFGILTEYTAFLATESREFKDADRDGLIDLAPAAAATNLEERAVNLRAGAGGARQQLDMQTKQNSTRVTGALYVNERMETERVASVQYRGDRTFFFRNARWVDSRALATENDKPDREITLGSPEYMALGAQLAAEGRQSALSFDEDVLIIVGKERILIKR